MPKRSPGKDEDQESIQAEISVGTQKENVDQVTELAAEQFAILFWKTWLHKNRMAAGGDRKKANSH